MKKKITAVLLTASLVLTQFLCPVFAADGGTAKQSLKNNQAEKIQAITLLRELDEERRAEEEKYTQRFIIKYKENKNAKDDNTQTALEAAFQAASAVKASKEKKRSEALENVPAEELSKYPELEAGVLAKAQTVPAEQSAADKSKKSGAEITKVSQKYDRLNMIKLDEKIDPDIFISVIRKDMGDSIEYIQQDYKLDISEIQESKPQPVEATLEKETTQPVASDTFHSIDDNLDLAHGTATGDGVIVAVIDTGIDITHPAIAANMTAGYNFVEDTAQVYDPDLGMEQAHGTHVAGIIAKSAPDVSIMPLKVFENGIAYTSDIISAIEFAENNGAAIVNCSFGSKDNNQALLEAIQGSALTFVCAAGNNRVDLSVTKIYPACFDLDNIISVTAFNNDFGLSYFSNYNTQYADIAAWGREVNSALPGGTYGIKNGTSMAAAYVSGAAALVSELGVQNIKTTLKNTADKLSCLQTKVDVGRKLNFANAVNGIISQEVINVTPKDDFDAQGYQPTPEESWELFSSIDNIMVAGGYSFSAALKSDGSVWAWGANSFGQLGDGTHISKCYPKQVPGLENIIELSCKGFTMIALTSDGKIYTWGDNTDGQVGDGTVIEKLLPVLITLPENIKSVAAGRDFMLTATVSGSVYGWGSNSNGQLGDGTNISKRVPTLIPNFIGVKSVSAGEYNSYSIKVNGDLYGWGENSNGQLGIGPLYNNVLTPVFLSAFGTVKEVKGGSSFTLALQPDGTVYACGYNLFGQLGLDPLNYQSVDTPVSVVGLSNIKHIAAGYGHSLALTNENNIYSFGLNMQGQLGHASSGTDYVPSLVQNTSDILEIGAGDLHSLAVGNNGYVYAWGDNRIGQVGDGNAGYMASPMLINGLTNVKEVSSGYSHTLFLKTDGTVYSCGQSQNGQLGFGATYENVTTPTLISGLSQVKQVAAGGDHSVFLKENGTVYTCGSNSYGEVGDGTTQMRDYPVLVSGISNVKEIAAGSGFTIALTESGSVYTWGGNGAGQLGLGHFNNVSVPTQILGLSNIAAISARSGHVLALTQSGQVYSWGLNSAGQLGHTAYDNVPTPTLITALSGITKISAGESISLAVNNNGEIYNWGYALNVYGFKERTITPIIINGFSYPDSIVAGSDNSFAIMQYQGNLYLSGRNQYGQSSVNGIPTETDIDIPTLVSFQPGPYSYFTKVFMGYESVIALDETGQLYAWGSDYCGKLGLGHIEYYFSPHRVISPDGYPDDYYFSGPVYDGDIVEGTFDVPGDVDCFNFTAPADGTYTLQTVGDISTEISVIDIYNGWIEVVNSENSIQTNNSFKVTLPMTQDNCYLIYVSPVNPQDLGSYSLYVNVPSGIIIKSFEIEGNTATATISIGQAASGGTLTLLCVQSDVPYSDNVVAYIDQYEDIAPGRKVITFIMRSDIPENVNYTLYANVSGIGIEPVKKSALYVEQ